MRSSQAGSPRVVFVTGTDTGVGKTLLTALLTRQLRRSGIHALAMKPICSGGRGDARLLRGITDGELSVEEINPFSFPDPVAPLVAQQQFGRVLSLAEVLGRIQSLQARCACLVVEGAGGLRSPLGQDFDNADLAVALGGPVVVAARNRLGVINQGILTVAALQAVGVQEVTLVLMGCARCDRSSLTNLGFLREKLPLARVEAVPFLGRGLQSAAGVSRICKKVQKTLARCLGSGSFCAAAKRSGEKKPVDSRRRCGKLTAL